MFTLGSLVPGYQHKMVWFSRLEYPCIVAPLRLVRRHFKTCAW